MSSDISSSTSAAPAGFTPFRFHPSWFYFIFAASGFAGLIYESVWTRYLKLFLGHAALAQALVLIIFLFGLAAGSAATARFSSRIRRPLLVYALIEAVVALAALGFHDIYILVTNWMLDSAIPHLGGSSYTSLFKWSVGAALILPQSLLLGATFPLMSAGLVRHHPQKPGGIVAMLYFANSFGAALGVIVSGFTLIPAIGLPGAMLAAGLINIAVALIVWLMDSRQDSAAPLETVSAESRNQPPATQTSWRNRLTFLILAAALLTGFASLVYEIVWIRMLSLLLGSSTHSFELMLSAFIMGLAFGGLLVRKRADRAADPLALLGWIQIVMGVLALTSLFLYPLLFHVLAIVLKVLPKSDAGYQGLLASHFIIANAMMLPTTVCAGMTLPLLTRKLMNSGGEQAVGAVYAANTLGAIIAVAVTGSLLMPALGVKIALIAGAITDLGLGLVLLAFAAPAAVRRAALAALAALVAASSVELSPALFSSQVYRTGNLSLDVLRKRPISFHRDGNTASVTVYERTATEDSDSPSWLKPSEKPLTQTIATIATNGKPDAGLYQTPLGSDGLTAMTPDETTMVMLGLLPLLAKPDARLAANVGFGSGFTTRMLLLSPQLERVDTVEIEKMMVEGARHLGPRVAETFTDPRSRIIIDDAKSFFAAATEKYDILVSEPSNPWVSGVAGLFTREFYHRVRQALAKDGIFIQWLHLYENNAHIIASVEHALMEVFSDYRIYLSGSTDVIFIVTLEGKVPDLRDDIFAVPEAREILAAYRFRNADDMDFLFLGDSTRMHPYFASFNSPANSDYFPFLENNAPRAFFLKQFYPLSGTLLIPVALYETLYGRQPPSMSADEMMMSVPSSDLLKNATEARKLASGLDEAGSDYSERLALLGIGECAREPKEKLLYFNRIINVLKHMMPFWSAEEVGRGWAKLEKIPCVSALLADEQSYGILLHLWRANGLRDDAAVIRLTEKLLPLVNLNSTQGVYTVLSAMVAHYRQQNWDEVVRLSARMSNTTPTIRHAAIMLAANALENIRKEKAAPGGANTNSG